MSIVSEFTKVLVASVAVELRGVWRRWRRSKAKPKPPANPLSHKDVAHQQAQIKSATRKP